MSVSGKISCVLTAAHAHQPEDSEDAGSAYAQMVGEGDAAEEKYMASITKDKHLL